jgi:hypothetical protein
MRQKARFAISKLILLSCVTAPSARATLVFTNIADTTTAAPSGTFTGFGSLTGIEGTTVAFHGIYSGGSGIFTGSGGALTTIVKTGDMTAPGGAAFASFNGALSMGSTVAFQGLYPGNVGIFTGNGGALTTIVKTGDMAPTGTFIGFAIPSISGSTVAVNGAYPGSIFDTGIFRGSSGPVTTIVKEGDTAPSGTFTDFSNASISGSTVAFVGRYAAGAQEAVFTDDGSSRTTIVTEGDAAPSGTFTSFDGFTPAIDGSSVAFLGNYTGGSGIFTGSGSGVTTVATTADAAPSGMFLTFGGPAIDGSTVSFRATYSGGHGIFSRTGAGPLETIIKTGDSLFGSTVTTLNFFGLDSADDGNFSFGYTLADGRSGIAIAAVPEARAWLMLGLIAVGGGILSVARQAIPEFLRK